MANRDSRAPEDTDPLLYGKHVGKTYAEVYQRHPSYAMWAVTTAAGSRRPSAGGRRNQEDDEAREAREVAAAPDYPMEWDKTQEEATQLAYQIAGPQLPQLHPRVPEGDDPDL